MILAGDVGGTKTDLAFFTVQQGRLTVSAEATYPSGDFASFDALACRFLSEHNLRAEIACFGIAGPCRQNVCRATNLPWVVDGKKLAAETGVRTALVINDLEATAYAVDVLDATEFTVLQAGDPAAEGNAAVIAAGTGLGEAGLYWDGQRRRPFACEGGHTDFAPRNELEAELFDFLHREFGHVAWERVLSGPGLHNIYRFLASKPSSAPDESVAREIADGDPAAAISHAALAGRCPVSTQSLEMFVSLYGAEAGNLALKLMATGGLYVGGGIAPRILEKLQTGSFIEAFSTKGRLKSVLERVPVRVILTNRAALIGAAECARLHGQTST